MILSFLTMMGGSALDQTVQPLYIVGKDDIGFDKFPAGCHTGVCMLLIFIGAGEPFSDTVGYGIGQNIDQFVNRTVSQGLVCQSHGRVNCLAGLQACVGSSFPFAVDADQSFKKVHVGKLFSLRSLVLGITGRFASERVVGIPRNIWSVSSEYAYLQKIKNIRDLTKNIILLCPNLTYSKYIPDPTINIVSSI